MNSTDGSHDDTPRSDDEDSRRRLDPLIAGARKLAREGEYEAAVGQLEAVLDLDRAHSAAREILALIRDTLKRRPRALEIERLLNQAETYLEQGDVGRAQAVAAHVFDLEPDNQAALRLLEASAGAEAPAGDWQPPDAEAAADPEAADARLIARIEQLLARPTGPGPAELAAAAAAKRREEERAQAAAKRREEERAQAAEERREEERAQAARVRAEELLARARELREAKTRSRDAPERTTPERTTPEQPPPEQPPPEQPPPEQPPPVSPERPPPEPVAPPDQPPAEPAPPDPPAPRRAKARLGPPLAIGAVVALIVAALSLVWQDSADRPPEPARSPLGTIEIVLSSPGKASLDNFELPDAGPQEAAVHRFSDVPAGSHTVTLWRDGSPEREIRKVTVQGRKTTRLEVEVPW